LKCGTTISFKIFPDSPSMLIVTCHSK